MYGTYDYDNDDRYARLFDFDLPKNQQAESQTEPKIMSGLLGSVSQKNNDLETMLSKGSHLSELLGQHAFVNPQPTNDNIAQRNAMNQQANQSAMAQQQQQDAQNMQLALTIAKMFGLGV